MTAVPEQSVDLAAYEREQAAFNEAVDEAVDAQYMAHGYVDPDGEINAALMHDAAYQVVITKVAVGRDFHMDPAQSITRGELYAAVWPNGPAIDADLDAIQAEVRKQLDRDAWSLTGPSANGHIQRRLEHEGATLVLCRSALTRGLDPVKDGCFVTDSVDLMLAHSLKEALDKVVKQAESAQKRMGLLTGRHPEIAAAARAELEATLGKIRAALPAPQDS
jgi:hypothetical protein